MPRSPLPALAIVLVLTANPAVAQDLYYGLTLLDPVAETARSDSYILVDDGRIAAVGQGRPDTAWTTSHDMTGLYALPGLIDTHAHVTLGPVEILVEDGAPRLRTTPTDGITAHNARMLLSFGVTTIRNPGAGTQENQAYVDRLAAGALQGPEMVYANEILDRPPFPFDGLVVPVTAEADAAGIVAEQALTGAKYVKL